jgi:hypothetical protein
MSPDIEKNVRQRFASNIRLDNGAYLDEATYLHACPNSIEIGPRIYVMHGAVLHGNNIIQTFYQFQNRPLQLAATSGSGR